MLLCNLSATYLRTLGDDAPNFFWIQDLAEKKNFLFVCCFTRIANF
jgi:hypothetical protein